jgi:hypothetical protein
VNKLADLHLWGRAAGGWFALISWELYGGLVGGTNGHVHCSARVPAADLRLSETAFSADHYGCVAKARLPVDAEHWPALSLQSGRTAHHYGLVTT